jgi:hypothetical protein
LHTDDAHLVLKSFDSLFRAFAQLRTPKFTSVLRRL